MKTFAIFLIVASIASFVFYYWGLHTQAGNRQFDEMAGMIPFFSGVAGLITLPIALVLFYFARR